MNLTRTALPLQALWRWRAWPQSARMLASLVLMVALALVPHVTHLPIWIPLLFITTALWRLYIEVFAAALPPRWLRSVMALTLMALVVGNIRTLNGLESGTALLSVMAGMKLLESRAKRDYAVLVFIAFFLLFAEVLYDQSMAMLPYLIGCTLFAVTSLLQLQLGDSTLPWPQALRRTSRMVLQALPLTMLLFVLVPRLPGQFWVLPARGAAVSGLSDELNPGDVSNISLSEEVAFRVEFQSAAPSTQELYWRAIVLHDFDGRTWRRRRGTFFGRAEVAVLSQPYTYRMLLEPSNQPYVPMLDIPLQADLRRSIIGSDQQLMSFMPIAQLTAINAISASRYQLDTQLTQQARRADTALPGALNPRARERAREWRNESQSDAAYVQRLLRWFHTDQFYYTLEPPQLGVNAIDEFLFNTQRGFCEHYASALAFLLRAVDIPARVVTGYQGGEYNPLSEYWVIRQADAHAWVEAWLPGQGWTRLDPTAAIAAERIERGLTVPAQNADSSSSAIARPIRSTWLPSVYQRWDALNTFWKERIVNFDNNEQRALLSRLGFPNADWRTIGMLLAVAFVSFFLGLMLWLGWRQRPARIAPEVRLWRSLLSKLAQRGVQHETHEGPVDFINRAILQLPQHQTALLEIRDVYVALRYQPAPNETQLKKLGTLISQL